jgi:hypothetical protein
VAEGFIALNCLPGPLVAVSHLVYIDESGLSRAGPSIQSLWTSAAVALPFERARDLQMDLDVVRAACFRRRVKEIKGQLIYRHELLTGVTPSMVAAQVVAVFRKYDGHAWIVATRHGCAVPPGCPTPTPLTKDIARQLLFERINGFLGTGRYAPANWLMVWDIGNVQELMDLSASVARFADGFSGAAIDPRLYPVMLGGLSHDWAGVQIADVFAHLALHKIGVDLNLPDANAAAFDAHVEPALQRDAGGRVVGLKRWGV